MQSSPDSDIEVIDDFEAVRLLINVYLIKRIKCSNRPVSQERFINDVNKEFRTRGYHYSKKRIVYTWKQLLDNYQHYKKYFADEKARNAWPYFNLMDNCFEESKPSSVEKFKDSKLTFFLIESLKKHKPGILYRGITMDILQTVEDDFQEVGNHDINQKDIYNQWIFLKRFYKHNKNTSYYREMTNSTGFLNSLKEFFELEEEIGCPPDDSKGINASENELFSAIESIKDDENREVKRQKKQDSDTERESTAQFNIIMHEILLRCFKNNKAKIKNFSENGGDILKEAYEEFQKLGYNVTQESVANEWNDLSCRYELIKNTEHPERWPYYSDMSDIYNGANLSELPNEVEDQDNDNQSTIGSIIVENLKKDQNLKSHGYAKLTERLLNVYEANSKEFLEIKDILVERNLLKEETNYLLNMVVQKYGDKK